MVKPVEDDADQSGAVGTSGLAWRSRDVLPTRLAVGLGDPERESGLLAALQAAGDFVISERCLAADQLLNVAQGGDVDTLLLAWDLHRLSAAALAELDRDRIPFVLLAPRTDDPQWAGLRGVVLPLDAGADAVVQALRTAVHPAPAPSLYSFPGNGSRPDSLFDAAPQTTETALNNASPRVALPATLSPIAMVSGPGSPGRTTVALNLAAALGAVAPTVLLEADLDGPSLAAYLDADPTRNLALLAHAAPESARDWDKAIARETQAIGTRSPHGVVLCGIPKPELRSTVSSRFLATLIVELQARYRYVLVDIGPNLLGPDAEAHRVVLTEAEQVLLVASADLVGLWRARTALSQLQKHVGLRPEQVSLVINRHDARVHHDRQEMEWALGLTTAAVIPYDHKEMQRATASQRPALLAGRGRVARSLLELAERVHQGAVVLPPEPTRQGRWGWLRSPQWLPHVWRWRVGTKPHATAGQEASDGAASSVR